MQGDTPNPAQPDAGATPAPAAEPTPAPAVESTPAPAETPVFAQQPAAAPSAASEAPNATPPTGGEVPVAGVPVAGSGGLPKGAIIGICAGAGGLVLIILAIIFIPMLLAVDYKATYSAMEEFNTYRRRIISEDCNSVEYKMTSDSVSDTKYAEYATKCKSDIESLENAFKELEKQSGIKRDEDIKKKFEEFKPEYEKYVEAFKGVMDDAVAIHGFYSSYVKVYDYSYEFLEELNDSKIELMTKSLAESSNEKLKKFGAEFTPILKEAANEYKAYIKAKDDYYDDKIKYSAYYDQYKTWATARDDLDDKYSEFRDLKDEVFNSDFEDAEKKFRSRVNELDTMISKKYYEHYND